MDPGGFEPRKKGKGRLEKLRAETEGERSERDAIKQKSDTTDQGGFEPQKKEKGRLERLRSKRESERSERDAMKQKRDAINRKNDEDLVRFYKAAMGESDEVVETRVLSYTFEDTHGDTGEGGSSLGPLSSPRKQTVLLPQKYEENWRYNRYVEDMNGYAIRINHLPDDEESGDDDDATKTSATSATSPSIGILLPLHDTKGVYLLTFDGHHNKEAENGGYGALLRCGDGTPVAAVAGGSKVCISAYFHTLEGLESGLDLAISRDIEAVYCVCNSQRVCETLRDCFINNDEGECPYHPNDEFDLICRPCLKDSLWEDEPFDLVFEVVRQIVQKGQRYYRRREGLVEAHVKEWNESADFLAKFERRPGVETELAPEDFPNDLKDLVYQHGGRNPFIYN